MVKLVSVSSSTPEYQEVLRHFMDNGGRQSQLQKVERIQNPQLYSRYMTFKKTMKTQPNEKRLYHGTDAANIESINVSNLSRSFAGVNGK